MARTARSKTSRISVNGHAIEVIRSLSNLTQTKLADCVGSLSQGRLSAIEASSCVSVKRSTAEAICDVLDIPLTAIRVPRPGDEAEAVSAA